MRTSEGAKHVEIVVVPSNSPRKAVAITKSHLPAATILSTSRIVVHPFIPPPVEPPKIKTFMSMTQSDFYKILRTEESCLDYLREKGLLSNDGYCQKEMGGVLCRGELKNCMKKNERGQKDERGLFIKALGYSISTCQTCGTIRRTDKLLSAYANTQRSPNAVSMCQVLELIWMFTHLCGKSISSGFTGLENIRKCYYVLTKEVGTHIHSVTTRSCCLCLNEQECQ